MSAEKAQKAYDSILGQLKVLLRQPMSIENWSAVCNLLAKGMRVATIAKEEDVSVLPFYRTGLKYLRHAPKEVSIEQALETMDDSNEFYSLKEQRVILEAFSRFADRLEEWAEAMDLHHGVYWRMRENTRPWNRSDLEDYEQDDQPPYYGWVLVNINKIKMHFEPLPEPYVNEVNSNPFNDKFFVYQQTRQQWKFHPEFIETLLSKISEVPDENPLVGKYLEWGAKSVAEIPSALLKVKDGAISKELIERNLAVRDEDYEGLFKRLNGNANAYLDEQEAKVRDAINECLEGVIYENRDVVDVVNEKLDEVDNGLDEHRLAGDYCWGPVLAAALRLPRYTVYYFDWAMHHSDEGPDEPGLVYQLRDGTSQQVHCQVRESKWWDGMDMAEWKIQNIIAKCKNVAITIDADAVLNQWYDIETAWKKCKRGNESLYHGSGDTDGFAVAFCDGLLKLSVILPHIKTDPKPESRSDPRYATVEKTMAVCAKMKPSIIRFQLLCDVVRDGMDAASSGDPDFNVWEKPWIAAALQLLSEDPCHGECNLIDRQNMFNAIIPAFSKIVALFSLVQGEHPDMCAEELDYFYQDVNEVMRLNWRKHPETAGKGVVLTPDFVTREGINDSWEFNDFFIRRLASHCSAKNALKQFQDATVSDSEWNMVAAANTDTANASYGGFAEHILFQQAIDSAASLVEALEAAADAGARVLLSNEGAISGILQPFFGTYFRPYTRYANKMERDKGVQIDIPSDIKQLSDLVGRFFLRISKIPGAQPALDQVTVTWKKILTLYEFRMKNPYVRLARKAQEDYADLFVQIGKQLTACSIEGEAASMPKTSVKCAQTEMAKAVAAELKPELEALKRQGENANRNVLRYGGRLIDEEKQIRKNTQTLLREQSVDEELTAHDNEVYKPRYAGVDLEMLEAAKALVDRGTLNRSSAAQRVHSQYEGKKHGFSSLKSFKTIFYRYYANINKRG